MTEELKKELSRFTAVMVIKNFECIEEFLDEYEVSDEDSSETFFKCAETLINSLFVTLLSNVCDEHREEVANEFLAHMAKFSHQYFSLKSGAHSEH